MTMTPHQTAEFPTPWMPGLLAYPLLVFGLKSLVVVGGRAASAMAMGRRSFTDKDIGQVALFALAAVYVMRAIAHFELGPQWWSQPLHSGWEISFGAVTVLLVMVEPLLAGLTVLVGVVCVLAGAVWLNEPSDASDSKSPTHGQLIGLVAVRSWMSCRQRRTRTTNLEGRA